MKKNINQYFSVLMLASILLIFIFNFTKVLAVYNNDSLTLDINSPIEQVRTVTNTTPSKIESEFCQNRSLEVKGTSDENTSQDMIMPHMDHEPRHGGQFFMAANRHYHVEGVYSTECGFELYLYDEYTRPIKSASFQALIKVTQSFAEDETWESSLFLVPSENQQKLTSFELQLEPDDSGNTGEIAIELYLKFPGNQEPDYYNF
ncbi:MAG: hypothetical protein KZQ64_13010 [gamma proteobacterium symbiont of Bathyaustriella thionipta]|nr:hypothetical protein [gamma proteobacterium symbiont of Bathyaustriella thionipta]MCU7951481.1 hypothetical protein [gamma proteobacterium symbiont of Bathyaustriella thionipta]MCU7954290.1 hypothetical protein [gamma proteobacterium symbiont of Bathyaustriella thionipta]MCU7956736.1 hypothetical protein [gamma proteobacterium symbiont of Bathyaustriella thionipta]MCU7968746.1 hypothetical protein [gamma proteobacterium symbiont of Bathyaustriella thionipta]